MKKITRSNGSVVEVPDDAIRKQYNLAFWTYTVKGKTYAVFEEVTSDDPTQCDNCGGSVPDGHSGWCPFAGCSSPSNSGTSGAADSPTVEQSDSSAPEFDGCAECQLPWKWSEYSKRWWCVKCGVYKPVKEGDDGTV